MKKTALHPEHVRLQAKLVEFAGYEMPIQYTSIKEEHHAVRQKAGVFDVSHMGELHVYGKEATEFLDHVYTNNIQSMTAKQIVYGFLCMESGGVVDDLLIYKVNDQSYLLVVNAANKDKDFEWLNKQNTFDAAVVDASDDYSEVALQGPQAEAVLQTRIQADLSALRPFTFDYFDVEGEEFLISRTGYTGEDGFEIYGDHKPVRRLFAGLIERDGVTPCGLGARDTLRFEAALPLYGHEISEEITPIEAGYGFAVDFKKPSFKGREALLAQKEGGLTRRMVGLELEGKGIPREGYPVEKDGETIGHITSGYLSPTLGRPIALALIQRPFTKRKTEVSVRIRRRTVPATVRNKKFLSHRKTN